MYNTQIRFFVFFFQDNTLQKNSIHPTNEASQALPLGNVPKYYLRTPPPHQIPTPSHPS